MVRNPTRRSRHVEDSDSKIIACIGIAAQHFASSVSPPFSTPSQIPHRDKTLRSLQPKIVLIMEHSPRAQRTAPQPTPPPVSRKHSPSFHSAAHREQAAQTYRETITAYHVVRPSYPADIIAEAVGSGHESLADVGCGTGKLSELLRVHAQRVVAIDPSYSMLEQLVSLHPKWHDLHPVRATAEHTALRSGSIDAATCAQTWHWVDTTAASAEMARIIRPGGSLVLAWNTLDVEVPWVHRLTRIMHSGDTLARGFYPTVDSPWRLDAEWRTTWNDHLQVEDLHTLMHTRSFWLRSNKTTRAKMTANLNWYLFEHLGFTPGSSVELPYRTDVFRYTQGD